MAVKEATLKITSRQREGRAINAVAELLRHKLSVPNIYLEPKHGNIHADVLAVDRGGGGDLHAVEIELWAKVPEFSLIAKKILTQSIESRLPTIHRQMMSMPAHFRYIAVPNEIHHIVLKELSKLGFFSDDGIGKIGIITIQENGDALPLADIVVPAERFRVDAAKLKLIETKLLDKSRPDIEVRI